MLPWLARLASRDRDLGAIRRRGGGRVLARNAETAPVFRLLAAERANPLSVAWLLLPQLQTALPLWLAGATLASHCRSTNVFGDSSGPKLRRKRLAIDHFCHHDHDHVLASNTHSQDPAVGPPRMFPLGPPSCQGQSVLTLTPLPLIYSRRLGCRSTNLSLPLRTPAGNHLPAA
jgi:hypothetical protein